MSKRNFKQPRPRGPGRVTEDMKLYMLEDTVTKMSAIVLRCGTHADDCSRSGNLCSCGFTECHGIATMLQEAIRLDNAEG